MRKVPSFLALLLPAVLCAQVVEWQHLYQVGAGMVQANATTTDADGNVYVTGFFAGSVDVDPGPEEFLLTSAGDFIRDGFVISYTPEGSLRWAVEFDCTALLYPKAIAVDAFGGVVVGGTFVGTADLDPGAAVEEALATDIDAFLVRLDTDGGHLWSNVWSNTFSLDLHSVGFHPDGSVTCGLMYFATLDVDPGEGEVFVTTGPPSDGVILHLNASGHYAWSQTLNHRAMASLKDLTVTPQGRIVACGSFGDTLALPGVPPLIAPSFAGHGFVVCLDAGGQGQWIRELEAPGSAHGFTSIGSGADGRVAVTAQLNGTVDIDLTEEVLDIVVQGYSPGYFVIDADGAFVHSGVLQVSHGFADRGEAHALAFGPEGDLWITGEWVGTLDTDPGDGIASLMYHFSGPDCFLVHLGATGDHLWSGSLHGGMTNVGRGLACDAQGNTFLAAQVSDDFFPFNVAPMDPPMNGGFASSMVVKLGTGTTGLSPMLRPAQLSLFPSPALDQVQLPALEAGTLITLRSASGAVHQRVQAVADQRTLNVSALAPGLYTVEIRKDDEVRSGRFVKE